MPTEALLNDFATTLTGALAAGSGAGTVVPVASAFPAEAFSKRYRLRVGTEIVLADVAADGTSVTVVSRAAESAARFPAATWPAGTKVRPVLTEAGFAAMSSTLPDQSSMDGASLVTDGTNPIWVAPPPANPIGLVDYGFVPINGWAPVISIRPGGALRNCRPFVEKQADGSRKYVIYADRYDTINESTDGYETAWSATSIDPPNFTQAAVIATKTDLASQLGGAIQSVSIGGTVKSPTTGLYNHFLCAVDSWATVSKGGIYRFTSPNPDVGPWAFAGKVIDSADYANRTPVDHSTPVYHPGLGAWFMIWLDYTSNAFPTRQMVYGTAPALEGPWTKVGALSGQGGYALTFDGAECFVDGDRVYAHICVDDYLIWLYDVSNPPNTYSIGPVVHFAHKSDQNGDPGGGRGGVCRVDDDVYVAYQANGSAAGTTRYAGYMMRGLRGSRMVYCQAASYFAVNGQSFVNGSTFAVPSIVPAEALAVDVLVEVKDTGSPAAGAFVAIDGGYAGFPMVLRVASSGVIYSQRGMVQLKPRAAGKQLVVQASGISSGQIYISYIGYKRLPA